MKKLGMFLLGFAALVLAGTAAQAAMEDDNDNKFTLHGEIRFRGEWWDNLSDFTDSGKDPNSVTFNTNDSLDMYPYRVRLAARGELGHDIWIFGELQNSGVAGDRFAETVNVFGHSDTLIFGGGETTLYQGYVKIKDVADSVLDVAFGRQEIVFDRGLHFSSLDFYNGISHDGVMAAWDWDNFAIHGFWTKVNESNVFFGFFDGDNDADNNLYGAHFKHMTGKDEDQDVAYYLFYQTQNVGGLDNTEDRGAIWTLGGRWGRTLKGESGWVWNAELALQGGDFSCYFAPGTFTGDCFTASNEESTLDHKAWVFEGALGYNWHEGKTDQKIWGSATWATGDDDPNDSDNDAYSPLYTDFHNRLGYADLFAVTNIQAYSVGYKINVDDRHAFGVALWNFSQAEHETDTLSPLTFASTGDALASACFDDVTPPAGESCSDDLGNELDLFYNYYLTENFSFDTALSWFEPGDAIEDHWSGFGSEDAGDDAAWRLTAQARGRW